MSDYDKRFNVNSKGVSLYTDSPAEALKWLDRDPHGWVTEGHAKSEEVKKGHPEYRGSDVTLITREITGRVSREHLEALVASQEYQEFKERVDATIAELYSA